MTIKEMLALATDNPDEFMVEVSRLISPPPWKHTKLSYKAVSVHTHRYSVHICQCGLIWDDPSPCTIPPKFTESPADIAEGLMSTCDCNDALDAIVNTCRTTQNLDVWRRQRNALVWFVFTANPCERILCCLIAKGLVHE